MKRTLLCLGLLAPMGLLWACTGDDDVFRPNDAGVFEASTPDQQSPSPSDGGGAALAPRTGTRPQMKKM